MHRFRNHRPSSKFTPDWIVEARWRAELDRQEREEYAREQERIRRASGDRTADSTTDGTTTGERA